MTRRDGPDRAETPSAAAPRGYAALDLGTNNCRLLIADRGRADGLRVLEAYSRVVRLGEGLAHSGRLSDAAMERAMDALSQCAERIRRYRPKGVLCVATQACRAASNGRAFLDAARRRLGLPFEIISPKQEAKYALLGAIDLIDPASDFALVIDIGGGSTELCWVDAKSAAARSPRACAERPPILGWASFPVGVVTLAEGFGDTAPGWYDRMVSHVREMLHAAPEAARFAPLFAAGRGQLLGNSGTVTSLAAVHRRLERYSRSAVDGMWLSRANASATRQRLLDASQAERAAEPCIGPNRADLILPGCAILEAVWDTWPSHRLRVGDRGLREGMIRSMIHAGPARVRRPLHGDAP